MLNIARLPYEITGSQGCRNVKNLIFDMFFFFAIFMPFLDAASHARCSYDCGKSLPSTDLSYKSHKTTVRSPFNNMYLALYCKAVARMLQNVRPPLKLPKWMYGCTLGTVGRLALSSTTSDSLANLQAILQQPFV